MNKTRIWYNIKKSTAELHIFVKKFANYNKEDLLEEIATCDLKTFRLICNFVSLSGWKLTKNLNILYHEQQEIIHALNNRVNEILGEYAALYDFLIKSQGCELWNGDERYKLFGYDLAPYDCRKVMKSAIKLICEYLQKPLETKNLGDIVFLSKHGLYWELVQHYPYSEYTDWRTDDLAFEKLNEKRKEECEAWVSFMDFVFEQDYEKAYEIMVKNETNVFEAK